MVPSAEDDWLDDNFGNADAAEGELSSGLANIAAAVADAADMALLRSRVAALVPGVEASRITDHEVVAWLGQGLADGRLARRGVPPRLLPLAPPPAAPTPPPPAPSPRRAAPPAPAAAPATTFSQALDVAAMVAVLRQAARDGVPFCEECAKAAAQRDAAGATA